MKFENLTKRATKVFYRTVLKLKKHSPEILVAAGAVGTVATTVLACRATTKVGTILDEAKEDLELIRESKNKVESGEELKCEDGSIYTIEDVKKDTFIVYTQTGVKMAKLYGTSIAVGVLSLTSILVGHNILRKRSLALAAAYTAIDKGFKDYRKRVVERFGTDVDHELRYDIKPRETVEKVTDKKGNEKEVKKTVDGITDPNSYSDYARIFDDGCAGWCKDAEYNLMFLKAQQNYANDLLKSRGHLFLNEVYDLLGFQRTKAGNVVGWIYDEKNPIGDNFVDFDIFNVNCPKNRDFVNGYERSIILDFNVDGPILEYI